jgi:hypothetical protein
VSSRWDGIILVLFPLACLLTAAALFDSSGDGFEIKRNWKTFRFSSFIKIVFESFARDGSAECQVGSVLKSNGLFEILNFTQLIFSAIYL